MAIRKVTELGEGPGGGPSGRLMGLDVGAKTIGVALSDPTRTVATPLRTIRRTRLARDADAVREIVEVNDVAGLVVGLPINMDGSEGPRARSVRQFAANLVERLDIDVAFWDERLSTAAVERAMLAADLTRAKRKRLVDKLAAAYILQGALDFLKGAKARP